MATEHNGSVHLVCDHVGSLGSMATKHNGSVHLVCDHVGSLGAMATEHNGSVHLVCDHVGSLGAMATEHNGSVVLFCFGDRHGSEHNGSVDLPYCSAKLTSIQSSRTTAAKVDFGLLLFGRRSLETFRALSK